MAARWANAGREQHKRPGWLCLSLKSLPADGDIVRFIVANQAKAAERAPFVTTAALGDGFLYDGFDAAAYFSV